MIEIPGRIPIVIHPIFWLFAGLIGFEYTGSFGGALIMVGIILFSVLIHEYGHALTAVLFRQTAAIHLVALGGLTYHQGPKISFWKQFLIVLNGPLFGFLLYLFASFALSRGWGQGTALTGVLLITKQVNLVWTILNLLPVMPLDGGQLLRIVLEAKFGLKGYRFSLLFGAVLAVFFGLFFSLRQAFFAGALFFLFAFQCFDQWRSSAVASTPDRDEGVKDGILQAEQALAAGDKKEAERLFEEVRRKSKKGLLFSAATQYLAFLKFSDGESQLAYELLLPLKKNLSTEGRLLLHQLAADAGNWEVVAEFSIECYQDNQKPEIALRNARAFAHLKKAKPAGGWLQTAMQEGELDVQKLLNEEPFASLKSDPVFKEFIEPSS